MDIENIESKYNILEVKKVKDFNALSPEYDYTSIGVLPDKHRPEEIGVIFFNGPTFNKSEYVKNHEGSEVTFDGPLGEFAFHKDFVRSDGKSPFVFGRDLSQNVYDKLLPLLKIDKPSFSKEDFNAKEINDSLKLAFIDYWVPEDEDFTSGLRNIHTIGERIGNDIDWSIMNFFDTKNEVKNLINHRWKLEGGDDKIEWLSGVFKKDKTFLKKLLDIQWNSIKSGFENEDEALNNLVKMLTEEGYQFDYTTYPPGHKKDRYDATDITIKIEGKKPFNIQVKPVTKTEKLENGDIVVHTYGMKNMYKDKPNLNYILYNKGNMFIMFKNENYDVIQSSNGREVIHHNKPSKIYK
jgi:hypothetical protein